MLTQSRLSEISDKASKINSASEKYQLIHATFAIEKLFKDAIEAQYNEKFDEIRQKLRCSSLSEEEQTHLICQAKELKLDANKKCKILVDYIPQMRDGSARITRTQNNTFLIVLPASMENTRDSNGKIDFEKLRALRELMAHELGHIVLHSGILEPYSEEINSGSEEEATLFAHELIALRKKRNAEIYCDNHYQSI